MGKVMSVTKIAKSQDLGICKHVKFSENWLLCASNSSAGPTNAEIVLFDWPRLLTTPSFALRKYAVSIAHAQTLFR